jgi:hypothetical protein
MSQICNALFEARRLVIEAPSPDQASVDEAKTVVRQMMDKLRWSEWLNCGPCQPDEICMMAMWPFGKAEDHFHPSCKNSSGMASGGTEYWPVPEGFRAPTFNGF